MPAFIKGALRADFMLARALLLAALAAAGWMAVAAVAPVKAQTGQSQTGQAIETPDMLPDHPGRDEAFGYCIGCHSFQVVGRQGMSRERWDETLTWMTARHNMPAPDAEMRKLLLDYLVAAYPEQRASTRGWSNPFAPQR
jgi:hypothetical protein